MRLSAWGGAAAALAATAAFAVLTTPAGNQPSGNFDFVTLAAPTTARPGARNLLAIAWAGRRLVAVGEFGLISVSDDGGRTWRQAPSPTSIMLTSVAFADDQRGWAAGHDGVVLSTADGGLTWQRRLDGGVINAQMLAVAKATLQRVEAEDDSTPTGDRRRELADERLADAEAAVKAGPSRPLLGLQLQTAERGFAVGAFGQLLHTEDGGQSFRYVGERLPNPEGLHLNGIAAGPSGHLWIAGEAGSIFHSPDGGLRWTRSDTGYNGHLYGVLPLSESVVLAYGFRGHIFRSGDSGASWARVVSPSARPIMQAAALGGQRVLLATQDGELLLSQDQGRSFAMLPRPHVARITGFVVHPSFDTITAVGPQGAATLRLPAPEK
jgi:photosystem II stability/assembly factor-like uncharacterized protein